MSLLTSWLASRAPDAAVEIAPSRVSAASLSTRGGAPAIQSFAVDVLPAQAVVASLTTHNILDRASVVASLRTVFDRLERRPVRVALIIPDVAAKVSVVRFDRVPARRDDLEQLMRWQVRKAAPFPIEEAAVSFTGGTPTADGGGEFVVVLARRDVIAEYEDVCAEAGAHAGLVDIATFSVINLALAAPPVRSGDWLVVHMRPEYTSIGIVRAGALIFFRNRPEGDEESLTDVVHQTAMYYQDRLSGDGFGGVLLGGSGRAPGAVEGARRDLEERLGARVDAIQPAPAVTLPDMTGMALPLRDGLAPLAGMLLRTADMVGA
jgi:type IV pilus assembly protein PilM